MAFNYSISGVDDIDQKWSGLPLNGANYCVPASMLNWMYYFASHGHPRALRWPVSTPEHRFINLVTMADSMDTDADGTNASDALEGLADYLGDRGIFANVYARRARDNQDVSYVSIRNMLQMGGFMGVSMGRYKNEDGEFERESAHAFTLVGLQRKDDGELTMTVNDPNNNSGSIHTQSPSVPRTFHPVEITRNIEGDEVKVLRLGTSNNPFRFIDGWLAMTPIWALSNRIAGALTVYTADILGGQISTKNVALPFTGDVADIALQPGTTFASVLARATGEVSTLNLAEMSWSPLVGVRGAKFITCGGRRARLFVAQGREILAFDTDGTPQGKLDVGAPIDAMSYDQKGERLLVACAGGTRLLALAPTMTLQGEVPAPTLPGTGRLALSVNGRDSTLLLSRAGSEDVATLRWLASGAVASGRFKLLAKGQTAAAHVSPKGRVFVNEAGTIASFDMDGNRITGSPFDGLAAGPVLKVARSINTLDPEISRLKAWKT